MSIPGKEGQTHVPISAARIVQSELKPVEKNLQNMTAVYTFHLFVQAQLTNPRPLGQS